jgi:hypothetical protein
MAENLKLAGILGEGVSIFEFNLLFIVISPCKMLPFSLVERLPHRHVNDHHHQVFLVVFLPSSCQSLDKFSVSVRLIPFAFGHRLYFSWIKFCHAHSFAMSFLSST